MQSDRAILPPETRIGRTALTVVDLTAMVDFYQDIVGLTVLRHTDTTAVLGVEETPLLVLEGDSAARTLHRSGAGLFHNAFRVPTREALGDAYDRIQEHWHLGGASDHGVSEALYINDPEGNGIEIYRDYPRREWPRGDDGQIQMGTHPLPLKPVSAASAGGSDLPAGTDLGHIHLEVSSLDAFSSLYEDIIGFERQVELPAARFVAAGGYHHHIGANTWNRRSRPVAGRGLAWFEVLLPDTETLYAIQDRTASSHYSVTETDDGISITGPDEIEIRFRA